MIRNKSINRKLRVSDILLSLSQAQSQSSYSRWEEGFTVRQQTPWFWTRFVAFCLMERGSACIQHEAHSQQWNWSLSVFILTRTKMTSESKCIHVCSLFLICEHFGAVFIKAWTQHQPYSSIIPLNTSNNHSTALDTNLTLPRVDFHFVYAALYNSTLGADLCWCYSCFVLFAACIKVLSVSETCWSVIFTDL